MEGAGMSDDVARCPACGQQTVTFHLEEGFKMCHACLQVAQHFRQALKWTALRYVSWIQAERGQRNLEVERGPWLGRGPS